MVEVADGLGPCTDLMENLTAATIFEDHFKMMRSLTSCSLAAGSLV